MPGIKYLIVSSGLIAIVYIVVRCGIGVIRLATGSHGKGRTDWCFLLEIANIALAFYCLVAGSL